LNWGRIRIFWYKKGVKDKDQRKRKIKKNGNEGGGYVGQGRGPHFFKTGINTVITKEETGRTNETGKSGRRGGGSVRGAGRGGHNFTSKTGASK